MNYRAILYHKQSTSARLRFLRFANNSVCAFEAVPVQARLSIGGQADPRLHPAPVLREVASRLGLGRDTLRMEDGFRCLLELPGRQIETFLIAIDQVDPPFADAHRLNAEFADLTQVRGLPAIELELLRCAYELVMGG